MLSIKKMNRKPVATLKRSMGYSAVLRIFRVLSILLICFAAAGPVFAEDGTANTCQAASSLSVLVRGKNVTAYVPNGAWGVPTLNINVVPIEGDNVSTRIPPIPTRQPVNSCASNSQTGQTICTANNPDDARAQAGENDVYLISGTTIKQPYLRSDAKGVAMFNEGNCTNCAVAIDPVHNRAVIGLALNAGVFPWVTGFQVLDLDNPNKPGVTFPSQAPNVDGTGQQISAGFLIDPGHNLILSPNQHGTYEIIKLGKADDEKDGDDDNNNGNSNNKDKDNNKAKITPTFAENTNGSQSFGAAAADCKGGTILASIQDFSSGTSQVLIGDSDKGKTKSGPPAITWSNPPSVLTDSKLSFGANGIAVDQDTRTGIITGEFGFINPGLGGNVTAFQLSKNPDGKSPRITDWVTCSIDQGFNIGLAPHTVTTYPSPKGDDAMAVLSDFDPSRGVTKVAVIDLTKMLDKKIVTRTGNGLGHACAQGTLPSGPSDKDDKGDKDDRGPVLRVINLQ